MNKFIGIGRLTAAPEMQQTQGGVSVCRFSLAINRPFKNQNGESQADFLNIVAWRGLADTCGKYLEKGKQVAVSGSIQTRDYKDNNGVKRYITEIVADSVEFLGAKSQSEQAPLPVPPPERPRVDSLQEIEDDDLPF